MDRYARTLRTLTLSLRDREYIRAAKFMGVPSFTIIVRHLVPNLGSVLVINTVLGVIGAVNSETSLSFLGLGIKRPTPRSVRCSTPASPWCRPRRGCWSSRPWC